MEKRRRKQGAISERSSVKFCHFQNQVSSSGYKSGSVLIFVKVTVSEETVFLFDGGSFVGIFYI